MLPFLKNKQAPVSGVIIKRRKADILEGSVDDQNAQAADKDAGLETCVNALFHAIHTSDTKAGINALRDLFTILESQPHEENDESVDNHPSLNSFRMQNVKAAGDNT